MRRFLVLSALVVSLPALAQDFEAANRFLQERSYTRACDAFTSYVKKAPEDREAAAKKAAACVRAGRDSMEALRKLATTGEKDFARAVAQHALWERGELGFDAMAPLLQQAMTESGRRGAEARGLLEGALVRELDNHTWNAQRTEKLTELGLSLGSNAELTANYRLHRARARLQASQKLKEAEAELRDVGAGKSDLADDALYLLAERQESNGKLVEALELYDGVVRRFSPTTSNVRSSAESRAADIRRPSISLSVPNNELPGVRPQVVVSFRNVKNARWVLRRVDPMGAPAGTWPSRVGDLPGAEVKTWSSTLEAPARYARGQAQFELGASEPGLYALDVEADGQRDSTWALVSQHAVVTKTDRGQVLVALFDVETGAAQADAEVTLYAHRDGGRHERLTGRTDATGAALFKLERTHDAIQVFTRKGGQVTWASAGSSYWSAYSRENLAYVMTDRPLYKPGETVGLKLFLRTREGGPSAPVAKRKARVRVSDPQGKALVNQELTTNAFGTAHFTLPLAKSVTLGAYSVSVEVDSEYFTQPSMQFRVEEYKPPEYVVSVEPLGSAKPGEKVRFKVKAAYYSGGAVANAAGRALVRVQPWQHRFGRWPDDPLDEAPWGPLSHRSRGSDDDDEYDYRGRRGGYYGSVAQHTLQFKTGADGTAELEAPAADLGGQSLEYAVQVFVTDSSRREIQGAGSLKVAAQPYFVDLKTDHYLYRPGERVTVRLRAEDANGRPMDPDVVVRLTRLGEQGSAGRIAETRTRLSKGVGAVVLDADALGQVRAEVLDGAGPAEAVLASTDLWLTSDSKPVVPGPGFQLFVDRAPLQVGEKLRVLVAGEQAGGHVLLTLESDVLAAHRVLALNGRARFVELELPADVAPNGWLFATRYERTQLQQRQLPFRVKGSEVELGVGIDFGRATAEPGSAVTATVKTTGAAAGLPLETALTIVDESLFAIAPERSDFLTFFGRTARRHAVQTSSSASQRSHRPRAEKEPARAEPITAPRGGLLDDKASAGAMPAPAAPAQRLAKAAEAEEAPAESSEKKRKDAAGPRDADDAAGRDGEDPIKVRSDFSTSAGWYPALTSTAGAPLTQGVKLKDSLTSWKAVATVVSEGPNLGRGATQLRTAKPLMVRLQAPRFFVEGDEVVLSAVIESHLATATDVEVVVSAPGFKELTPGRKTLRVTPEQVVRFDAKFKVVELGERTLRATVRGGGTSDGMEWKLPAFVHGAAQRQFFSGRIKGTQSFTFELPEKRKASLTRLELNLSPTLLAVMFDALPYLAEYPYGCVEQTLSRFVPAAIARRAVKDLELPASRVPANLDDMTQKGLQRLYDFQHGDGGWGWWSSDTTNAWMTAYVVSSLSLARSAGLDVRADVIERGRGYLVGHLGATLSSPETHAYAVYALASTGGAPKAAVDTVYARRTSLSPRARALLALALLHQKDPRARVAVENLDDIVKAAQSRADASVGEANDAWSTSAAIEATAFTLMAYARYDLKSPLIAPLTDFLVLRRNGGRWRNTRDTAFAVYALSELARREGAPGKKGVFVVSVNGKEVKRLAYAKGGLDLGGPLTLPDAAFKPGQNTVEVRHDGSGTGYFGATADVFNMNDFIRGVGGDVKVKRTYTLLGKPSTTRPAPASAEYGMPVESGVRVRVDVELTANKAVEFVMLEDLKPAGFEAVQLQSGPQVCNYACAHAELRTDRVAMFLTQLPVGVTRLSYELRAEVPGRFAALPARVEAMYAPEITATADEMRFEVRDAPEGQVAR